MRSTSKSAFLTHFSAENLKEIVDVYLEPGSARGVDGTNYDRFIEMVDEETRLISNRSLHGVYRFTPYRQKLILKDSKSPPRQVSIPTIRDKIALRALNDFLSDRFHDARPQHAHPVISAAIKSIQRADTRYSFIKLDIKSFYDTIDHKVLLRNLRNRVRCHEAISLIESAICTPTGIRVAESAKSTLGVPQGLSISNILASIYLNSIDQKYLGRSDVMYHRYVDDILCIAPDSQASFVAASIARDLKLRKKLTVHPIGTGKSAIVPREGRIEYLGYAFSGDVISVRSSTEKKLLSSVARILHSSSADNIERELWRSNLRLSGCASKGTMSAGCSTFRR